MAGSDTNVTFGPKRVFFGIISWILFLLFVFRWMVFQNGSSTLFEELTIPLTVVVLVVVVTELWVRHNLSIYRRKGPRRARTTIDEPWTTDRLDRPLVLDRDLLINKSIVRISVDSQGNKVYRGADA